MKKNGFTLAEVLGVMVILGLLMILAAPLISNRIKNMNNKADDVHYAFVYHAAEEFISNNGSRFGKGKTHCINVSELINDGFLSSPVVDVSGNVLDNKSVHVSISMSGDLSFSMNDSSC